MAGGLKNFVAEIWEARLEFHLDKQFIFADIVNRDYEGDINGLGDVVRVNTLTDIDVKDYDEDADIVPDVLDSLQTTFQITEGAYWATQVKSVDQQVMSLNLLNEAMKTTGGKMKSRLDTYIANLGYTGAGLKFADSATTITAEKKTSCVDVIHFLSDLNLKFDEALLPEDGRWLTVPPWLYQKMVLAKVFIDTDNSGILVNGNAGMTNMGIAIKRSNNIPTASTTYNCLAGVGTKAISFAYKPVETKTYDVEKRFARGIAGLVVYGAKVMRPDFIMQVPLIRGDEPTA